MKCRKTKDKSAFAEPEEGTVWTADFLSSICQRHPASGFNIILRLCNNSIRLKAR